MAMLVRLPGSAIVLLRRVQDAVDGVPEVAPLRTSSALHMQTWQLGSTVRADCA